jgi:hypothetical protein
VYIGEVHAFFGKPINIGRGNFGVRVEAGNVSDAHIVREDVDNVGRVCCREAVPMRDRKNRCNQDPFRIQHGVSSGLCGNFSTHHARTNRT